MAIPVANRQTLLKRIRIKARAKLAKIVARDGIECHWCKIPTIEVSAPGGGKLPHDARTIDHVKGMAGRLTRKQIYAANNPSNLVVACHSCNQNRQSDRPFDRYLLARMTWRSRLAQAHAQ